jgi:protein gp37
MTAIQWTDETWNPTTGCTKVSPGCANCYIERTPAFRVSGTRFVKGRIQVRLHERRLETPLRWKKPRRVFVNSMSDLFHEDVPFEFIAAVFGVMAAVPRHTYQVLTKRPQRMREWFDWIGKQDCDPWTECLWAALQRDNEREALHRQSSGDTQGVWPLPNVWLGVSVENQRFADERIPLLLQTPATVRFISAEPLLGPVDVHRYVSNRLTIHLSADVEGMLANGSLDDLTDNGKPLTRDEAVTALRTLLEQGVKRIKASDDCVGFSDQTGCPGHPEARLDWVIVGGESGPNARPFDLAWARSIVQQCQAARVACFVKQLGAKPRVEGPPGDPRTWVLDLADRMGGDVAEWPEDLRVRQFPVTAFGHICPLGNQGNQSDPHQKERAER